jgi:outer membrane protein assembly factor BamE
MHLNAPQYGVLSANFVLMRLSMLLRFFIPLTLLMLVAGCSSLEFPWVYRIGIQQGNIIDQKDVDKLVLGMTKRQVQFVMGTALLTDTFNQDQWDYFFTSRSGDGVEHKKRFTVIFENDLYVRHEGDISPSGDKVSTTDDSEEAEIIEKAIEEVEKAESAKF